MHSTLALAALLALSAGSAAGEIADGVKVAGCWTGEVVETGIGRYPLAVDVTESAGCGRLPDRIRPLQPASSRASEAERPGSALFDEALIIGLELCVDSLTVRLTPLGPDLLHFEEVEAGVSVVYGDLARTPRDADGRCKPAAGHGELTVDREAN